MPDMSNSVTKAVLFTIRDIENRDFFKGVIPNPSQDLINYFLSREDGLTSWLNDYAHNYHAQKGENTKTSDEPPIDKYKSISEDIQKNADDFEKANGCLFEDKSLIEKIRDAQSLVDLQSIKASFLYVYERDSETERSKWEVISKFISQIPNYNSADNNNQQKTSKFTIEDYRRISTLPLNTQDNHCDKEGPLVRHRLGWYHKEDEDDKIAVCAVYPWAGETDVEHNEGWAKALLSTITIKYPSIESILLVCHDRDFSGFSGKDEVVTGGLFNKLKKEFSKLNRLIVFQHSNSTIIGALKKNKATDVFNAIENYAKGYNTFKEADKENKNANAHEIFSTQKP